jgi:hypothetical protein
VSPYNPYEHLTMEQLRVRSQLMLDEGHALLAEIDRRISIAEGSRKARRGLRVVDGGKSPAAR